MTNEIEVLKKQEELLQFESFDHEEAYRLGTFMVNYAKEHGITIAVSICMNNGCIVFQYCPDGTNLLNQKWMQRKFNLVKMMERSSLLSFKLLKNNQETLESHGLSQGEYALCGGGFPIRIKGSRPVLGAIIASNLYHVEDHEFIVDCLREFLDCPLAPRFPYTSEAI